LATIDARLAAKLLVMEVEIPVADGARLAWLYRHGEVLARADDERSMHLKVRLSPADQAKFEQL
jgi:GTP-binding protein HflX